MSNTTTKITIEDLNIFCDMMELDRSKLGTILTQGTVDVSWEEEEEIKLVVYLLSKERRGLI